MGLWLKRILGGLAALVALAYVLVTFVVAPYWLGGMAATRRFQFPDKENADLTPASFQLAFEDLGVQILKNIEHPIRLYRVSGPRLAPSPRATPHPPSGVTWTDALLHPSSLALLLGGAYLLATALGLPPAGRLFPAYGVVLLGVGVGRVLRLRTGRPAFFLIALGTGLVLGAVSGNWRHGPPWWLVVGGIVVTVLGLTQLRRRNPARARP